MHQHQQRAQPGQHLVPAQQLGGMPALDQLALAQRVGRGPDDQQRAGNAQPAADPQQIEDVQQAVERQCDEYQRSKARHEGQHLAAQESGLQRHQASSTSDDDGRPTQSRQWPGATSWSGRVFVLHRALEQPGLATPAAARAAAGLDLDAMTLCKVQQRGVPSVPGQGAARAMEFHFDGHAVGDRHLGRTWQLHGSRAEGLVVDVADRHAPLDASAGTSVCIIAGGPQTVELVAPMRQRAPQQFDVDMPFVLVVAPLDVVTRRAGCRRRSVAATGCDAAISSSSGLEGMLAAVAQPVVEMHHALRLCGQAPAQHAHHRRDADAAADQHHRHARIGVDEEVSGRRLHAQDVADLHMIVEVAGRQAGRELGVIGGRRAPA